MEANKLKKEKREEEEEEGEANRNSHEVETLSSTAPNEGKAFL